MWIKFGSFLLENDIQQPSMMKTLFSKDVYRTTTILRTYHTSTNLTELVFYYSVQVVGPQTALKKQPIHLSVSEGKQKTRRLY